MPRRRETEKPGTRRAKGTIVGWDGSGSGRADLLEGRVAPELRHRLEELIVEQDDGPVLDYAGLKEVLTIAAVPPEWKADFAYELEYGTSSDAFWMIEGLGLPDAFTDASTGEELGALNFVDGPAPGCDYQAVQVTSDLALSLLQLLLNDLRPGWRLSLG